jgi:hypothetical protein
MSLAGEHIGDLALRRHRAGEALGPEGPAIVAHASACPECRTRLRALDDEQRRFEQAISFDRFAAGVERAARGSAPAARRRIPLVAMVAPVLAMAAALALVVTFRPKTPETRIKGGAGMTVRIAGTDGQRDARVDGAEPLAAGERLRVGYAPGEHAFVLSLSIDARGEVTPLYPERGASLPISDGAPSATRFLPDSLELTGAGLERVVVILSDKAVDVETARRAARAAYDRAGGDLDRLPPLGLPGEEFSRTFAKP